jgi:two-component system, OmpR family, sensor kinase
MTTRRFSSLGLPPVGGPPLGLQMIAMLVCTLVAAQLVTLALTVLLPPRPQQQWDLGDVASALSGQGLSPRLEQARLDGPPDVAGAGWLISDSARTLLARRLNRPERDVVLAFYTQLPVGGVPATRRAPLAARAPETLSTLLVSSASAQSIAGGPSGGFPGGAMPNVGFPGGMSPGGFPGGMPGGGMPPRGMGQAGNGGPGNGAPGGGNPGGLRGAGGGGPNGAGLPGGSPLRGMPRAMPDTAMPSGGAAMGPAALSQLRSALAPREASHDDGTLSQPLSTPVPAMALPAATPVISASGAPALAVPHGPIALPSAAALPAAPANGAQHTAIASATPLGTPQPLPFRSQPEGLLDRATPPFIEGDFVAAVRRPDGHWIAVAPRAEPFPNRWQKKVLLWFVLSLVIVSPLAWFFARRIVLPLEGFARAAEMLGRDPSATIIPLKGPAEIGRAAHAFNQMHNRLRAFVDDRTAMVGAISHDLRTPLTRLRFRLEDVAEDQRPALLREVAEMESMINEVIVFIRDASTPGARQKVDLAALVADSVADARLVGGDVEVIGEVSAPVEVDPVGIRRLLGNLLENAVKYGERARVRVTLRDGEAMAEILDAGPGIPEEDMDRVFEPFYRSPEARRSGRPGSGLGLTVCRSIARAHGGDVRFARASDGFAAVLTVPMVYEARPRLAA